MPLKLLSCSLSFRWLSLQAFRGEIWLPNALLSDPNAMKCLGRCGQLWRCCCLARKRGGGCVVQRDDLLEAQTGMPRTRIKSLDGPLRLKERPYWHTLNLRSTSKRILHTLHSPKGTTESATWCLITHTHTHTHTHRHTHTHTSKHMLTHR